MRAFLLSRYFPDQLRVLVLLLFIIELTSYNIGSSLFQFTTLAITGKDLTLYLMLIYQNSAVKISPKVVRWSSCLSQERAS